MSIEIEINAEGACGSCVSEDVVVNVIVTTAHPLDQCNPLCMACFDALFEEMRAVKCRLWLEESVGSALKVLDWLKREWLDKVGGKCGDNAEDAATDLVRAVGCIEGMTSEESVKVLTEAINITKE